MSIRFKLILQCLTGLLVWAASCMMGALALATERTLPIGVAEFPPFKYTSPEGKIVGSDTEIVEQVFKRMGYTPSIQMQPWKRVQYSAERGEFAAIYTFTKTPEREKLYFFSDPINIVRDVFFKQKGAALSWQTLDDLKTFRVGVSAGYAYAPIFKYAIERNKFAAVVDEYQAPPELGNLRKLKAGITDVFICEVSVCQYFIQTHAPEFSNLDYIDKSIGDARTFHVGFPKSWVGSEQLAKDFNAELAKFVQQGHRAKIFKKYHIANELTR